MKRTSFEKQTFSGHELDLSSGFSYQLFYQPSIGTTSCFYPFTTSLPVSYWIYAGLLSEKRSD